MSSPIAPPPYTESLGSLPPQLAILPLPQAPPLRFSEETISSAQRRRVRSAHGRIRVYDIGWRGNWIEAIGGGWAKNSGRGGAASSGGVSGRWMWVFELVVWGGRGWVTRSYFTEWKLISYVRNGDGHSFPRNPNAEEQLSNLSADLMKME